MAQQRRSQTEQRPSADPLKGLHQESAGHTDTPTVLKTNDTATDASRIPRIERIARRAYELFEQRGGDRGREVEDWLRAEQEIDSEE